MESGGYKVQDHDRGLAFKAHRLCVSLNSRLESKEEEEEEEEVLDRGPEMCQGTSLKTMPPPRSLQ